MHAHPVNQMDVVVPIHMEGVHKCKVHGEVPLSLTKSVPSKTCRSGFAVRCNQCSSDRKAAQRARKKAGVPARIRGAVGGQYVCQAHGPIPLDECGKYECATAVDGFRYVCPRCSTEWRSASYKRDPEASKQSVRSFKRANPDKAKQYRDKFTKNPGWVDRWNETLRKGRWEQKLFVLNYYGDGCVLCGEEAPEFLCLDHVENDGHVHRRESGLHGSQFYDWLVKNNLPDCGVQVLCHNCNQKKHTDTFEYGETGERVRGWRFRRKIKLRVMTHYSGGTPTCACCKVSDLDVLSMDHIDGGGNQHRREIGSPGSRMHQWLHSQGFPSGFRVLCHNCNFSHGAYGRCPHSTINSL